MCAKWASLVKSATARQALASRAIFIARRDPCASLEVPRVAQGSMGARLAGRPRGTAHITSDKPVSEAVASSASRLGDYTIRAPVIGMAQDGVLVERNE